MFIDHVKVHVKGGRGGNGVTAFRRQPYEPKGPPDGGDGGHGGSVVVRADPSYASLIDLHHRPHRHAGRGRHGSGDRRRGADGADERLGVPVGTVIRDARGQVLADLLHPGDEFVVAEGGRGGRGNAAFRTPRRRSPRFHEFGAPGEQGWVTLELKLLADVALVGFPNAGKSSLIARISAARPKIADYPFTTLAPNLGVVRRGDVDFVVADVPGLIPGAAEGRGLGHDFLRHIERARILVHVLDCASYEQRDPREDLATIVAEVRHYDPDLLTRPALVLLNKVDADREVAEIVAPDLAADGWRVLLGSAVSGEGMGELVGAMAELVARLRAEQPRAAPTPAARPVLRPVRPPGFVIEEGPEGFVVSGPQVQRWVAMTDLDNEEAVDYLAGRLARAGVERALLAAGARAGDTIDLAGVPFDFTPDRADLAELVGEDLADDPPGDPAEDLWEDPAEDAPDGAPTPDDAGDPPGEVAGPGPRG